MICIIDYGCGNLFSLKSSLEFLGLEVTVSSNPETIKNADKLILPGVGAFGDAMELLEKSGLNAVIKEQANSGKNILGICLGMQLLFEKSYEYGKHQGLGLLKGEICPFKDDIKSDLKIPHMGWNSLNFKKADNPLLKYITDGDYVYFVHSYYAKNCADSLVADSEYEVSVPALVNKANIFGAQFHPEKSGDIGLKILKAFSEV